MPECSRRISFITRIYLSYLCVRLLNAVSVEQSFQCFSLSFRWSGIGKPWSSRDSVGEVCNASQRVYLQVDGRCPSAETLGIS